MNLRDEQRAAMPSGSGPEPEPVRNVLFIMCDQLRFDALSCSGLSPIETPTIDGLARRGVRFDRAYIQGAVCGSSRMSYYTGRYVQSHGARWNSIPLAINQPTLGDYLRPLGVRTALLGKTHHRFDKDAARRLGLGPDSPELMYVAECGFEATERDDGLHPDEAGSFDFPYNRFLRAHGFDTANPWQSVANSSRTAEGEIIDGWLLRASPHPAIVPDELSETAYLVDRAIDFVESAGDQRWCLHLSFIKPHWPYVVSSPYHQLLDPSDVPVPQRSQAELATDHPVLRAFQESRIGATFSHDHVRTSVYPAYLGLVKQVDDHLGRLLRALEATGDVEHTMIVFCSDHGDYLGDHWMGEKDWFHEPIVRVPLIIVDPRTSADATRGSRQSQLVETIDIVPTLIEALGGDPQTVGEGWLEGTSLLSLVEAADETSPTEAVFCETDFGFLEMSNRLSGLAPRDMRATMVRTDRFKYILPEIGDPLLYDLEEDPWEFTDRSGDPALAAVQSELHERLFCWFRSRRHDRVTAAAVEAHRRPGESAQAGFVIGYWDEAQLASERMSPTAWRHKTIFPPRG